jgi:signal peptidase II
MVRSFNLGYLWPTFIIVVLDQLTKVVARATMSLGESIPVLGGEIFRLTRVENTGVAFGLNPASPIFLIIFNSIASVVIVYLILTADREGALAGPKTVRFSLALILGGAIGNLIDRILFGHVTDFLDSDFPDFIMTRWPVFNVADSAVTVGVTIWIIYLVFSKPSPSQQPRLENPEDVSV